MDKGKFYSFCLNYTTTPYSKGPRVVFKKFEVFRLVPNSPVRRLLILTGTHNTDLQVLVHSVNLTG